MEVKMSIKPKPFESGDIYIFHPSPFPQPVVGCVELVSWRCGIGLLKG